MTIPSGIAKPHVSVWICPRVKSSLFVRLGMRVLVILAGWLCGAEHAAGSGSIEGRGDDAVMRLIARAADGDAPVQAFYAARTMRPAWSDERAVDALAAAIATLADDGLVPRDYRLDLLSDAYRSTRQAASGTPARAEFDVRVTRLLLRVLHHLALGKVDPTAVDPDWELPHAVWQPDFAALSHAVDTRQFTEAFAAARPHHALYEGLRAGLAHYREIERRGGWRALPGSRTALHPGDRSPDVPLLRARLAIEADIAPPAADCGAPDAAAAPDPECYDAGLAAAVRAFQRHHLLRADGVVGVRTRSALNVPVAARIAQIRVNLERARWLLHGLPEAFVLVDVPGYQLSFFRPGGAVWRTRIVVGRPARPTPLLRSAIAYLTFNPTWTIPPTILREDVLPRVRREPEYLAHEHISVLSAAGVPLDPHGVDWSRPGALILRQEAGPQNALGRVAIRFPNRHEVYLHDTPAQELFDFEQRAFSSGCIRVQNALEFVRLLLDDDTRWHAEALAALVADGRTRQVDLARRVPLIIYYWTVQADADGALSFRPDVYVRDAALLAALDRAPSP